MVGSTVTPPPAAAKVDYQLGGAYPPPEGVTVLVRDHTADPVPGLYNIGYVNALQTQPGDELGGRAWFEQQAPELLLAKNGKPVVDGDWGEILLDISTPEKQQRLLQLQLPWLASLADRGFQAVEPDNQDSFERSKKLITPEHAWAYLTLFAAAAHERGLAVAQKNNAEYCGIGRTRIGFDFVIAEECEVWDEAEAYTGVYGQQVIEIEYTDQSAKAFRRAVEKRGGRISLVRRDRGLVAAGEKGYHYEAG